MMEERKPLKAAIVGPHLFAIFRNSLQCAFRWCLGGTRGIHDRGTREQSKGKSEILRGRVNKYNIGEQGT